MITEWIIEAVLKIVWMIVIQGPLALINAFDEVFRYLTSRIFYDLLFGGKSFNLNSIPFAFYAFSVVALLICIIIFIIQYLTLLFIDELTIKERFVKSLKSSALGIVFTMFIPLGFFLMTTFIDFLQQAIMAVFGDKQGSFAKMLYKLGDPKWDGVTLSDKEFTKDFNFGPPANIREYNFITQIFGTWFMLYTITMVGLAVAQKLFELYALFIIGPLFAATMPNDNGVRMWQWRDSAMGKMLVSVGTLLVYSSFVVILSFLIKTSYDVFENSFISRQLMTLIAILGGGVYCQVMPSFFANFVNESVSAAEGRNSLRGAKAAGGMLKSGLAGGMLALGVGKAAKERAERKYGNDPRYANRSGAMRVAPNAAKATDATGGSAGGDTNDGGGGSSPRMRRTGAMGAVGKVIRGASSMVSLGGLGAAVVLGALGHSGSKTRLHQSGERIKKGIGDTKGRFKTAWTGNTTQHAKRKDTFGGNKAEAHASRTNKLYKKWTKAAGKAQEPSNSRIRDQEYWKNREEKLGKKVMKSADKLYKVRNRNDAKKENRGVKAKKKAKSTEFSSQNREKNTE